MKRSPPASPITTRREARSKGDLQPSHRPNSSGIPGSFAGPGTVGVRPEEGRESQEGLVQETPARAGFALPLGGAPGEARRAVPVQGQPGLRQYRDEHWVYVPANDDPALPASVLVIQHGACAINPKGVLRVPTVMENVIHRKEMPATIGIFITPGQRGYIPIQRHRQPKQPERRVRLAQ